MSEQTIDRDLVIRWVNDLKTTDAKQGTGYLRSTDDEFCCLGRLVHIVSPDAWKPDALGTAYLIDGESQTLPESLAERIGLGTFCQLPGGGTWQIRDGEWNWLASYNDDGVPFPEIADALIAHYGITAEELAVQ